MNEVIHTLNGKQVLELNSERIVFNSLEEALDLIGDVYYRGFDKLVLYEKNLPPDFFELKTGLAGSILQKFTQYQLQLAIIGTFDYDSKSLKDFIRESNKGGHVSFVGNLSDVLR